MNFKRIIMCNFFNTCITAGLWTFVQTGFHLAWTITGMLSYLCVGRHTNYLYVYIYITYFYRKECGKIELDKPPSPSSFAIDLTDDSLSDSEGLYQIIWDVVHNATFSDDSVLVARTYTYVTLFVVLDVVWLVTATILIIGTWYNVRKYWVFVCFSPWLVITALMVLIDVVAAVHYGLDIIKINSVTGWLKLIGVVNYNDFLYMNDYELDPVTSVMPSVVMCTLCCRMFVFWIPNVYMFYTILSAIINVYQGDKIQRAKHQQHCRNEGTELNVSAQERILRWQMYYGTISSDHNGNNTMPTSKKKKHVQVITGSPVASPAGSPVEDGPSNIRALFEMNSAVNKNVSLTGALMSDSNIASTAF